MNKININLFFKKENLYIKEWISYYFRYQKHLHLQMVQFLQLKKINFNVRKLK